MVAWRRSAAYGRRNAPRRAVMIGGMLLLGACAGSEAGSSPTAAPADTLVDAAATISALDTTSVPPSEPRPAPATAAPTTEAVTTTTVPPTTTTLPPMAPLPENRVAVAPLDVPLAAVGSASGSETARVQQRLLDLGFWLGGVDGSYGLTTRQAVMAFQKYVGLEAHGEVDDATAAFMSNVDRRAYGRADAGTLVEIDKTRQLLMFVVDGKTRWVFNTSTGDGEEYIEEDQNSPGTLVEGVSLTPDGIHSVNRERPVGWWEGDLGQIYRPKYFVGGVAVHGSNSVPNYPASHGCVRVTTEAMDFIWEAGLMPMGLTVWVHQDPRA